MKKQICLSFLFVLIFAGAGFAEDSGSRICTLETPALFSRETVAFELPSAYRSGLLERGTESETVAAGNSQNWVMIVFGLAVIGAGAAAAMTSSETETVTFTDPIFGFESTFEVTQRNQGQLYGGIGLAIAGGILSVMGAR